MFNKIIEFQYSEDASEIVKDVLPEPINKTVPDWYKKLKHSLELKTVKGCIPFLDTLTSGYVLKMPQDFFINHNYYNEELKTFDSSFKYSYGGIFGDYIQKNLINFNDDLRQTHSPEQLGNECPFHKKNKNLPYYKILNPFIIKTPPGYSCLFVPPLNNTDDRFSIIPGIVDTDSFPGEINFPIIINGDKYPNLVTTIERGTCYVQIIPFKRNNWEMKISKYSREDKKQRWLTMSKFLINNYRKLFWKRKKWI